MSNKVFSKIVESWEINLKPEYRGFRCANCQKYIFKAWHYSFHNKKYRTPVHLCNSCNRKLEFELNSRGIYKAFTCDACKNPKRKMYHIWKTKNETLEEIHICKDCYN